MEDRSWPRARTPFVTYTYTPQSQLAAPPAPITNLVRSRIRHADVRLQHGMTTISRNSEAQGNARYSQAQALAGSTIYAHERDAQGMANACLASGCGRRAEVELNMREEPRMPLQSARRRTRTPASLSSRRMLPNVSGRSTRRRATSTALTSAPLLAAVMERRRTRTRA